MYEASRDGLFRTRRDIGNNPDFEETRKVFASKMTKIHMQKHQEEMARNNQAMKMNGGHNSACYTKDRPPINSGRQPGEAAAKPPILSGPLPGTTTGNQYAQFDGQKHYSGVQSELAAGRAYGYGNNYDNKERLEPHTYQSTTHSPPSPGNASHSAPTHGPHPISQPAVWTPSNENQFSSSVSGSCSASQQQHQPAPPSRNTSPPQHIQPVTSSGNWSPPSSSRGWVSESSGTLKPDLMPTLPLSAFTGGADFHVQRPISQSAAHNSPLSQSLRPSNNHNGHMSTSTSLSSPSETSHSKAQAAFSASIPGSVSKSSSQSQGQSQTAGHTHCGSSETEVPCSPKSHLTQPPEQGPSAAEIKLEALTKRLEKEMDAQPKADYFGKIA